MKIRKGFVSNSSSSSFVCDVCGEEVSGMDMSLSEAEMYECENGHTFCKKEAVGVGEDEEINLEDGEELDEYQVPAKYCPCCQFQAVSDGDIITYFMKEKGLDREGVAKMFKAKFPTYEDFNKFIKANR